MKNYTDPAVQVWKIRDKKTGLYRGAGQYGWNKRGRIFTRESDVTQHITINYGGKHGPPVEDLEVVIFNVYEVAGLSMQFCLDAAKARREERESKARAKYGAYANVSLHGVS